MDETGLNGSILDRGWHEQRRQLEYKLRWWGGVVLAINLDYTSTKMCGDTASEDRPSQSQLDCLASGYTENAGINDVRNIIAVGHAV